jgi:hypothetical protein
MKETQIQDTLRNALFAYNMEQDDTQEVFRYLESKGALPRPLPKKGEVWWNEKDKGGHMLVTKDVMSLDGEPLGAYVPFTMSAGCNWNTSFSVKWLDGSRPDLLLTRYATNLQEAMQRFADEAHR